MRRPTLKVCEYRRSETHPSLDLRPFGQGRRFFKPKAETEALRQRTLHQKQSREAVGLEALQLSSFIEAKKKLSKYDRAIADAVRFHAVAISLDPQLAKEVLDAKKKAAVNVLRRRKRRRSDSELSYVRGTNREFLATRVSLR